MLMTNQQAAELSEPGVGPLHNPAAFVTPEFAFVFMPPLPIVAAVRCNQFNATLLHPLAQRIGVEAAVGDHPLRPVAR